jgi:hypothetical protein
MPPFWQATISTLAGVVVGFLLVIAREWWRERPRLRIKIEGGRSAYAIQAMQMMRTLPTGPQPGDLVWVQRPASDPEATLLLELDLLLINSSHVDNAIGGLRLVIHRQPPMIVNCPAQYGDGEHKGQPFFGVNVPANSLQHLRLHFEFPKRMYGQFPEWSFDAETSYTLEATPVRGRERALRVEPTGFWVIGLKDDEPVGI